MSRFGILIVEDEVVISMELEAQLLEMGHKVIAIAANGRTAIEKIEKENPDLVFMDITLKGSISGIDVAKEARSRFATPVIFTTAYADADTLQRARLANPAGFLFKPFCEKDIAAALDQVAHEVRGRY